MERMRSSELSHNIIQSAFLQGCCLRTQHGFSGSGGGIWRKNTSRLVSSMSGSEKQGLSEEGEKPHKSADASWYKNCATKLVAMKLATPTINDTAIISSLFLKKGMNRRGTPVITAMPSVTTRATPVG